MSQQTAYNNQAKGFAGTRYGHGHKSRTGVNDRGFEKQQDDITITASPDATTFQFEIDGFPVAYTSPASGTTPQIVRDGLVLAARDVPELSDLVSVRPQTGASLRITAKKSGVGFTATESDANLTLASVQANGIPEPIPFGLAAVKRTGAGTEDQSVTLPSAGGQIFRGVVERQHQVVSAQDAGAEAAAFSRLSLGYEGMWLVKVEVAVAVGDPVFFRHTAPGTEQLGAWRNDNDGGNADQVSGASFESSTAGAGFAVISFQ